MKVIIGVAHEDEEELNRTRNEIGHYSISRAGIELPEDYVEREKYGISTFFFGAIASHLRSAGVNVLPLENPEIWNTHQAIEIAKSIRDGRIKREVIETDLKDINNRIIPHIAPEELYGLRFFSERYKTALEIVENATTLEKVIELWKRSNDTRELYVLRKIEEHRPDIVIVGNGHAQKLKDSLPEYKYLKI